MNLESREKELAALLKKYHKNDLEVPKIAEKEKVILTHTKVKKPPKSKKKHYSIQQYEYYKLYYKEHRNELLEKQRLKRIENKEKISKYRKEWRLNNLKEQREKERIREQKYKEKNENTKFIKEL